MYGSQKCMKSKGALTSASIVEFMKEAFTVQILFLLFPLLFFSFQISLLNSAVNHLKANVKSAADLISLPATVEGLQKVSAICMGTVINQSTASYKFSLEG